MTDTNNQIEEKIEPLTLDALISATKTVLRRRLVVELENGEKKTFEVQFRRLTYGEIATLDQIPEDQPVRYIQNVVFTASLVPKFENMDRVLSFPSGLIRNYASVIILESGRDPFIKKK